MTRKLARLLLGAALPATRLIEVQGGHMLPVVQPRRVAETITSLRPVLARKAPVADTAPAEARAGE